MLTEDEARQKWCPFAQDRVNRRRGDEREGFYDWWPMHVNCIASECMAWRWRKRGADDYSGAKGHCTGHCGLAGKP